VYFCLCFAYCNCTVVLIVWTISQVLVLCAAFLCLSDWLMLLLYFLYTVLFCHCANDDDDDDDDPSQPGVNIEKKVS